MHLTVCGASRSRLAAAVGCCGQASVSTDDYADKAQAALAESNATITHFIDQDLLEKMLGASTLALTVLVDADGRVFGRVRGAREWDSRAALDYIHATFRHGAPASK